MSRSWNEEELKSASDAMVRMGHMSYDEFCKELYGGGFNLELNSEEGRKVIGEEMSRKISSKFGCDINVNIRIGE